MSEFSKQVPPHETSETQNAAAEYTRALAVFCEKYSISPELREQLDASHLPTHCTGFKLFDNKLLAGCHGLTPAMLHAFDKRYAIIYHNSAILQPTPQHPSEWRARLSGEKAELNWEDEAVKRWREHFQRYAEEGSRLHPIVYASRLSYYQEAQPPEDLDFSRYISDATPRGTFTQSVIADILAEQGKDVSKETLDTRFTNAMAHYQLKLATDWLHDVGTLCNMSDDKKRRGLAIADKYKDKLLDGELASKIEMFEQLSRLLASLARRETDARWQEVMNNFSLGVQSNLQELEETLNFFCAAYTNLGYELPSYLAERERQQFGVEDTPPVSIESLRTLAEELAARVGRFNKQWRLKSGEKRGHGLTAFQGELLKLLREIAGDQPGYDIKERASDVTTLIYRLSEVDSTSLAAYFNLIQEGIEEQANIHASTAYLLEQYKSVGHLSSAYELQQRFAVMDIADCWNLAKEHWPAMNQLVVRNWPGYNGAVVAQNLGQLFRFEEAPTPATAEVTPQPANTLETLEELRKLVSDGHIEEIFFPGETDTSLTEEQVKQELRELGWSEQRLAHLDTQRILDLNTIKELFDGQLYDAKSKEKFLGMSVPYFVVIFEYSGNLYAVGECPIHGSATYLVAEKHAAGNWLEIFKLRLRRDARELGAVRIIHSARAPHGEAHVQKIVDKVIEFDQAG